MAQRRKDGLKKRIESPVCVPASEPVESIAEQSELMQTLARFNQARLRELHSISSER